MFFDATDDKARELVEKYGEDVFGLTKENIAYLQKEILIPEFEKRLPVKIHSLLK